MENKINLEKYLAENFKNFNLDTDSFKKSYDLIPAGTLSLMRIKIRPGNYEDGYSGYSLLNQSAKTGALYLNCEFTLLSAEYRDRKIWNLIGIYSPKGPDWGNIGKAFIKNILCSSRNIARSDTSSEAIEGRSIQGFEDLQNLVFVGRVDVELGADGEKRNVVKTAILPEHPRYKGIIDLESSETTLNVRV